MGTLQKIKCHSDSRRFGITRKTLQIMQIQEKHMILSIII